MLSFKADINQRYKKSAKRAYPIVVVRKYNLEPLPWKPIKRQPYDITKD